MNFPNFVVMLNTNGSFKVAQKTNKKLPQKMPVIIQCIGDKAKIAYSINVKSAGSSKVNIVPNSKI
ncbi:hypothetical protein [Aliiglaciecola lipolytica]|uniref:Uncharacterized protein n=1 Tax=Aliiglaciecola lipolytica E3 TaxID=1127673 RepID=K6WY76_9ALTE|nr:hypothetical protein [Aliiglaciecola lipolytica]GAC13404.1 hypothetical protein GLIP_0758 [Aliiglaciecola lipolytica E3]